MNKTLKDSLDVIWYFMAFFLIQFIMIWAVRIGTNLATGQPLIDAANAASRPNGDALVLMMLFSSILTILVFGQFRWSPWSRDYLRSKPWLVVVWTIILSLGTILHQRTSGPQQYFAKVTKSSDLRNAKTILTRSNLTYTR